MDFALRCNSLKCRAVLTERAVVTTCSHIFCNACSDSLRLSAPPGGGRSCPACQTQLPNPDDAVSTFLNPTDDYKTSVLSGLTPSIIMECAGRALAFWCYQSTQEIVYQEYLAKSLTDKYSQLNVQMDRLVTEANSEMAIVNQKLSDFQNENERLRNDNTNLVAAFREKSRKHQQTQELYDRLKRREMTKATQSAAFASMDNVLGAASNDRHENLPPADSQYGQVGPREHPQSNAFNTGFNGAKPTTFHQRRESDHSQDSGGRMPPPPLRRPLGHQMHGNSGANPTPSNHRTRLGPPAYSPNRMQTAVPISADMANRIPPLATPSHRQIFADFNSQSVSRKSLSGYGMSAGMKVGRQQGETPIGDHSRRFDYGAVSARAY